jgi:hypothetical protein
MQISDDPILIGKKADPDRITDSRKTIVMNHHPPFRTVYLIQD